MACLDSFLIGYGTGCPDGLSKIGKNFHNFNDSQGSDELSIHDPQAPETVNGM